MIKDELEAWDIDDPGLAWDIEDPGLVWDIEDPGLGRLKHLRSPDTDLVDITEAGLSLPGVWPRRHAAS